MRKPSYLAMEEPDREAVVDFLGEYPVTVKVTLREDGELWIMATSATQDAPILIDETAAIPHKEDQ